MTIESEIIEVVEQSKILEEQITDLIEGKPFLVIQSALLKKSMDVFKAQKSKRAILRFAESLIDYYRQIQHDKDWQE